MEELRQSHVSRAPGVLKEQVESQSMELGRNDVDQSFILMFNVVDESSSWYFEDNIKNFCSEPDTVDQSDGDFEESNLMHGGTFFLLGFGLRFDHQCQNSKSYPIMLHVAFYCIKKTFKSWSHRQLDVGATSS